MTCIEALGNLKMYFDNDFRPWSLSTKLRQVHSDNQKIRQIPNVLNKKRVNIPMQ